MQQETRLPNFLVIFAITVIGGLEAYALSKGINGIALSLAIGAIAALGGAKVGEILAKR